MNIDHITFQNLLKVTADVFNSGPAMLVICSLAAWLVIRSNRRTIKQQDNILCSVINSKANIELSQDINKPHNVIDARPKPKAKQQPTKVSYNWAYVDLSGMTLQQRRQIKHDLLYNARIGRDKIEINIDKNTGMVVAK